MAASKVINCLLALVCTISCAECAAAEETFQVAQTLKSLTLFFLADDRIAFARGGFESGAIEYYDVAA